eukprot:tig00021521_g22081.t1
MQFQEGYRLARTSTLGAGSALLLAAAGSALLLFETCAAEAAADDAESDRELSIAEVKRRLKQHADAVAAKRGKATSIDAGVESSSFGGSVATVHFLCDCSLNYGDIDMREADVPRFLAELALSASQIGAAIGGWTASITESSVKLKFGGGGGWGGGGRGARELALWIRVRTAGSKSVSVYLRTENNGRFA